MYLAAMQWMVDIVGTFRTQCTTTYGRTMRFACVLSICVSAGTVQSDSTSGFSRSFVDKTIDGALFEPETVQFSLPATHRTFTFDQKQALEIRLPDLHPSEIKVKQPSRRAAFRIGTHRDIPAPFKGELVEVLNWEQQAKVFVAPSSLNRQMR